MTGAPTPAGAAAGSTLDVTADVTAAASADAALAAVLAHQLEARYSPGALLHVERAGRVLARHAVGLVQPASALAMHEGVRFRVASLTKPVVTLAALMLTDEGRLDLDAPLAEHLPELADMRLADGQRPRRPPSVRDLMRHTSGLAYPQEIGQPALRKAWANAGFTPALAGLDQAGFLAKLAQLPLVDQPGTRFAYGYSTDVLGCIVARLGGQPLGEWLRQRVFEPLGMHHTGFALRAQTPADAPAQLATAFAEDTGWHAVIPAIGQRQAGAPWMDSGGGGLISTLDDYAAFGRLLADGGQLPDTPTAPGGRRLLSQRLFDELARQQLPEGVDGPAGYCGPGFGFGLGLAVRLDWGPAAQPCSAGELTWSGISGTALYVQPRSRWFMVLMSANMGSRLLARMMVRRALVGPLGAD